MTDDIFEDRQSIIKKNEAILFALLFGGIGLLTMFDIYEDWHEQLSTFHLLAEALIVALALSLAGVLIFRALQTRSAEISDLVRQRRAFELASEDYKLKIQQLQNGVSEVVATQLNAWNLTPAEQDVSQLLLKGLSLREIADLRGTSERTIRQQASVIYKKSGLNSRSELSAYFLEDLLSPLDR